MILFQEGRMRKNTFISIIGLTVLTIILAATFFLVYPHMVHSPQLLQATSLDGETIAYTLQGKGDTALIFIHGWCCDSRYWRNQIPQFSKKYQVVTIDLAGHGHSGMGRTIYSLRSFGEDVKAVVNQINAKNIIFIGHSMGGGVAAQATLLNPERIRGIIGIDNLQNVEEGMPPEQINQMVANFKKDFPESASAFINDMIVNGTDPKLKNWIIKDISSAPANVGISTLYEFITTFNNNGMAHIFDQINVPVYCINANLWPTNTAANQRHIKSFTVNIMEGYGHFIMLENPEEFNSRLEKAIKNILQK